ncbi:hypothetical protein [Mucilaginibacter agri]|uniref:Uncharacterized protein n=1 Tax=Mucilaginibacter agri TaxID=2695265 RepID=A0A965ZEN6_9SPHI|nr:hypothetical protein [Mucilaginibacter agri]NCD69480.1 hypothetical protein [Mucilaginibacter agri]
MKKTVWLLCLICCGCVKKDNQQAFGVKVMGANAIGFNNVDYNALANLQQDSLTTAQWQAILPVYRMPADSDMKDFQQPQPGRYQLKDSTLVFLADTPFRQHSRYFARYYRLHDDSNVWTLLKGKWKHSTPQYTECTFTP